MSDNRAEAQKFLQLADDAAFNQGDKEAAYNYTKKAAALGDAEAMYYLGNYHREGIQIRRYEKSGKLPRKLIEDRCLIEADNATALKWYSKAADGGNGDAMRTIACAYEEGKLGLNKDESKACEWFNRLIGSGDTKAMSNLGYYYLEKKSDRAIEWFERAANYGEVSAIQGLAITYNSERYYMQDYSKALKYWQKLVDMKKGSWVMALSAIGHIYRDGDSTVKRDYNKALEYYKRALAEGDKEIVGCIEDVEERMRRKNDDNCFITTAVCETLSKPDDCYELKTFRDFRDNWLLNQKDGKFLIDEYYRIAPQIVDSIRKLPNSKEIFFGIWKNHLKECLTFIEVADYPEVKKRYISMVYILKNEFLKCQEI